jgi:hypothetical protein
MGRARLRSLGMRFIPIKRRIMALIHDEAIRAIG